MAGSKSSTAFGVALPTAIALNAEGKVPSQIMLLPLRSDGLIRTVDGRGPYRVANAAKLVEDSTQAAASGLMPIDENHSIDIAAPKGAPSPARGWMRDLAVGADGIYAAVNWTSAGNELVATQAYRGISVVFEHTKDGTVTRIKRAALVNNPNLRDVVALNAQEDTMDLLAQLRKLLGLADDADQAAVIGAVESKCGGTAMQTALQAQLAPIATAVKLKPDADAKAVLDAITALAATANSGADQRVTALQGELATMTENFNNLQTAIATDKATAFVDGAIKAGRVGVKPMRDHYIARHAANAAGAAAVEKEINAMPILGPSGARVEPPAPDKDGKIALSAEQTAVAKALGLKPEDMQKTLAAQRAAEA